MQIGRQPPPTPQRFHTLGPLKPQQQEDPQRTASASGSRTVVPALPLALTEKTTEMCLLLRRPERVLRSAQNTEVWEEFEAPN